MNKTLLPILLLLPTFIFAQWTQVGQDINGENNIDQSGFSVSMSSDGNIIAIGAPLNDDGDTNAGHVRVYQNNSGTWQKIGQDINGENWVDQFGYAVSMSADGNTVAIGARFHDTNFGDSGYVKIYQNNGGTWQQVGQDIGGEANSDQSGSAVSLSSNGNIVAIGAPFNDDGGSNGGQVRVYENNGGTWQQIGQDIDGESSADAAGTAVSISADGSILAVGAPYGNGMNSGYVQIYQYNGTAWQKIGQDIEGTMTDSSFGISVSMANDGNTLAIGSSFDVYENASSGKVRVYQNNSGTWQQVGQDIANTVTGVFYTKIPVSLSGDGSTVVIGVPHDDDFYNDDRGNSYVKVYKNIAGNWQQVDQNITEENAQDGFGTSVSISDDGSIVGIGARYNDSSKGHVRVFFNNNTLSTENAIKSNVYSISPNPSSGKATIYLNEYLQDIQVQTYAVLGKEISRKKYYATNEIQVDLSNYPQGIYLLKVVSKGVSDTLKIIKQ
ncbi:MAG: T9SS type A sorting domain-containing protein [Kordia sp.]|uniref:T9SS type A sorting domain-containing protein n=1 Tax=Kordia sp. TaxID=1965332 RepID=UPI00385E6C71